MTQSAAGSHGHFELFKSRTFEVDHKRAMVADEHDQHGGTLKVRKPHLLVAVGGLWQLHLNNAEGKEDAAKESEVARTKTMGANL
jgi:hypothetical protein